MSDYISREALIGKVEKHYCAPCKGQGGDLDGDWCRSCVINSVLEKVRGSPAADVAPVRRGNWEEWWPGIAEIMTGEEMLYRCSACDAKYADIDGYKYCPYCGAKMDKEETNELD